MDCFIYSLSNITERLNLVFGDSLQATFPKLKRKRMDVTFLPGNLLHEAGSQSPRGLGGLGSSQTCQLEL